MMKRAPVLLGIFLIGCLVVMAQPIDRKKLVQRHNITNLAFDTLASLTVGNGAFAFTMDATGLQTFPEYYANGVPLGTQSEWGWHSFPNTREFNFQESWKGYYLQGRHVTYSVQWNEKGRNRDAADFFRQNPHRLQLGNIGFSILKTNGQQAAMPDYKDLKQTIDLYSGIVTSSFTIEGEKVEVTTSCMGEQDAVAITVKSRLLNNGRLRIRIRFPYPTGTWADYGTNFTHDEKHLTTILKNENGHAGFYRVLDDDEYYLAVNWQGSANMKNESAHSFLLEPKGTTYFTGVFHFSKTYKEARSMDDSNIHNTSTKFWEAFWKSGGAIDFEGSMDKRAQELERRIILSQYLTRVQCAGNFPPQETGLTYNSWFGKPHLEMHWWHGVHFALWGRTELLEKSLNWYFDVMDKAKLLARRQGYTGARWQKMVDHSGNESPSSVGAFIIWQQPHPITFAELIYRNVKSQAALEKYKSIVFETAEFMSSFAWYDSAKGRYMLGPGLIPAQERFKAEETLNPTYELNYWYWALQTAQQWRKRLGMPRNAQWDKVLRSLSALPVQDNIYLATESAPDSYTNPRYLTDHPSVLGTVGMLPETPITNRAIMKATFDKVWETWNWDDTWGWDFPMTAMAATRLGMPDKAIEALLMPIRTNTYLKNGHNYQDGRLRIYLPGNGGVLIAAAMMVGGYEGSTTNMPGIPKDGKWKVRYEGLQKMP
jgi:hypothetical protein